MTEARHVEVRGGRIYVEVEGDGHPVLLIHGGLGSLRMWDGQAAALADRYRVIRYDTRGWGRTETDAIAYTDGADAAAVLDHVGATSAYVVGQSRGGSIALDFVLAYPERADALVSVAGGVGGHELDAGSEDVPPWDEMTRLWEAKDWPALAELETRVWVDGWGQPPTRVDAGLRRSVHDWIEAGYAQDKPWGDPQPLDPPAAGRLGEVRIPTMVMIGEVDEASAVATGRHLADSVAGARLVEFAGVAHMIQLEEPGRFNRLLLEFFEEVDRSRAS